MKRFSFLLLLMSFLFTQAQEIPEAVEQQLENNNPDQNVSEDDSYLQQLSRFVKDPLDLNIAGKEELNELGMLTPLQIDNLLSYRKLLGKLIDLYELQAVPGWDVLTIRRVLRFITVAASLSVKEDMYQRLRKGDHGVLFRISQAFNNENDPVVQYAGSPQRIYFRYRYNYKNLLQYGMTADKDAGEQFFSGTQKMGFDFYSVHVFARNIGSIRALAAGDFTVNMGQGLIQWQSLAFKKSGEVMNIKRQSPVLRPYNSAGEFNFHRGAGITIHKGRLDATVFFSFRKLSAGITIDTVTKNDFFTSFQTSGYHRTINEMEDRNRLGQQAAGTTISYDHERLHIGINGVLYRFSLPLQKRDEPYNLFAISGKSWYNASIDYSYTWKNCHFFGEAAIDRNFHRATLNGLLISISSKADVSLLHRVLSMQYQAVNGNAFTENTSPSNENGWYAGLTIRPSSAWLWDAYMDVYRFPWLKYQADAPSSGRDFLVQVIYTPSRKTEMYIRYKNEIRQADMPGNVAMHSLTFYSRQNCRVQINYSIDPAITVRTRTEMTWFEKKENDASTGFLFYTDIFYRPPLNKYSGSIRFQYFEADSYDARLYAYENNVPYSYSVLVFSGKGYRYYLILNYELSKKISCSMRWSRTIYGNSEEPLYGPGLINRSESEMKFQLQLII